MRLILKTVIVFFFVLALGACKEKGDTDYYHYLMQHPNKLRTKLTDCQLMNTEQERSVKHCDAVYRAGNDVMALIELQQKSPERFGLYILQAQMSLAAAEDILQKQQQAYTKMRATKTSRAALDVAKLEIDTSMRKKREIIRDIRAKLAVVSLSSPD